MFFIIFFGFMPMLNSLYSDLLPIHEHLSTSKEKYVQGVVSDTNPLKEIHFVMGNESADLDSVVSAIAYAHLLNFENCSQPHQVYLPLLNLQRKDFFLRKDIIYLFDLLNISLEDLLFLDDGIPLEVLLREDKLRIQLVDHNSLNPRQKFLSSVIEGIVDHHKDEEVLYPLMTDKSKLIATVGSASTLIAEKFFLNNNLHISPELALLLLAPILVDTSNLQSIEKTTSRDVLAVETLKSLAAEILPSNFYEKLFTAKHDVSGLTLDMLLRKDFKEYLDGTLLYGISSFPTMVTWSEEDIPLIRPIIEEYAKHRKLSLLFVMMTEMEGLIPRRRILVYSPSCNILKAFHKHAHSDQILSQVFPPISSKDKRINFYVGDKMISRKYLQTFFNFSQNGELMQVFEQERQ